MKVYGFVGPSGTGKSYRALEIAGRKNVSCILDDGLLIKENQVLAGSSAKREASRIASVRRALYTEQSHAEKVRAALAATGEQSVMILGTSAHMVDSIARRLGLPPISEYIEIGDVATRGEIEAAQKARMTEGKHVIPVPTFAIKKEFSGYFLAPLKRLVRRGRKPGASVPGANVPGASAGAGGAVANSGGAVANSSGASAGSSVTGAGAGVHGERTVVRPTYSYLGDYTISRAAIEQLVACIAKKTDGIVRTTGFSVEYNDGGLDIGLSLCVRYGAKIHVALNEVLRNLREEVDRQASLQIREASIVAESLDFG